MRNRLDPGDVRHLLLCETILVLQDTDSMKQKNSRTDEKSNMYRKDYS